VVGYSSFTGVGLRAFIYQGDAMRDLGSLGGVGVTAFAINNRGAIVGAAANEAGRQRAFIYADERMIDLNTLIDPEHADRYELQSAVAINDEGAILASGVDRASGAFRSFFLTPVRPVSPQLPPAPQSQGPEEWAQTKP